MGHGLGGANTLAQALHTLRRTQPAAAVAQAVQRLRVYTISDQDDTGAWLRREFPGDLLHRQSRRLCECHLGGINQAVEGLGGDVINEVVSNAWLARHIQQGHGPLGAIYPDVAYGMEGDTPSFLGLIPNGLNAPEHPNWGGWGGRYERYTPKREDTDPTVSPAVCPSSPRHARSGPTPSTATGPSWPPPMAVPSSPASASSAALPSLSGAGARLFRTTSPPALRWTTHSPAEANHPPVVRLAQPTTLDVRGGDRVTL